MALDGLNGFYCEGTPTGTSILSSGTGFDYRPSLREQLQEGLTGKKNKNPILARKYSDGTINYRGITYANEEAFRIGNPGVQFSSNVLQADDVAYKFVRNKDGKYDVLDKEGKVVETFDKKYQAKNAVRRYISNNQTLPLLSGQPIVQQTQFAPRPIYQMIPDGPFAGRTGKYVNGELVGIREITVKNGMMGMEEISLEEAGKRFQKPTPQPVSQPTSQPKPATISFAENIAEATEADAMEALARERAGIPQATMDEAILAAEEAKIAPKPQAPETPITKKPYVAPKTTVIQEIPVTPETPIIIEQPVAPEGQKPAGSTIEFNAEPAPNAPRPNAAEAEGLGRIVAEDAGAGAKTSAEAGAKSMTEAGSKSFFKSGKGKVALVLGSLALVGATLFGLSKCSDDNKQQLPPVGPEKKPEPQPEPKSEPEKPVAPVQPEKPEQNQEQESEYETISVVKGSDEWKYAELELIAEHLGQAGYRPSNQEITDRMMQIIERENKTIEEAKEDDPEGKNRHSIPTLNEGDMLKVSPELKKLIDEATNELKEANKDNPNYKVTWTELRAKVQEKLAA